MKLKRPGFRMTTFVAFLSIATLLAGCKKDDYVENVGVCPVVQSTNPSNGATNVPLDQIVTATFNEEMNPATITPATFTLTGGSKSDVSVAGVLTYNNTNATLSFDPTAPLLQNTTYTGTVKSTIKDLNGNALQTNYVWTFSTGVILSPSVISTDPANNATGVFINKVITATFSVPMDPMTITVGTFTLHQGTTPIAGAVSYAGRSASFTPAVELTPNTLYTGTITTGVKNLAGTTLENNYVWTFTTGTITGPMVISTDPTNHATGVSLDQTISATFSMAMAPLTINATTFTVKQGLNAVSGTVSYSNNTASFVPAVPLMSNTLYVCTITSSVKNLLGISLAENYVWSFTTGSFATPWVTATDPASSATGVVLDKKVSATFSVVMDPLTLNTTTFTLKQGTTLIAGTVSYTGKTATFTPTAQLSEGTLYTATITAGAQNVAGVALAADYVWTFTTLTAATPPVVILTDPANNAVNVDLLKTVTATFSMPMNPATMIAANFTIFHGTTPVSGTISYSGSTITFDPLIALTANTVYTATIKAGVKNLAGVSMVNDYVWTFTTLSPVTPMVISTDPANNATNVTLNKTVTATFSMPMDPLTMIAENFTIYHGTTPIGGTISYSGSTITFDPLSALLANTVYTCTMKTGVKNLAGVSMANDYVWTFTTLSLAAPLVISTDPANNATNVVLNKTVIATFNMPMDPLTMIAENFTIYHGTTPIGGTISYSGSTISFDPLSTLLANTVYTCTITNGVKNLAGVSMVNDYVWTFTTLSPVTPIVISTDPANNATNIALDKIVTATFSMPMDPLTMIAGNFNIYHGTTPIGGTITYSGSTITFDPLSTLLANTVYTCTITTGVKNLAGVSMANDYVWTFTTLSQDAPLVVSTDPENNATNVEVSKLITATFNMPMNEQTINSTTFTLFHLSIPVDGIVSYFGTTATFTPSADLLPGTTYTATITTGAENEAGVALMEDYVWSFSTGEGEIIIIDLGTASIFGAFGGNAGITNQGINTVINGAISTTAASTLVTGFHDGLTGDVYTETPLNVGLVTNGIYTAPPFPGTATSEAIAIEALIDANAAYLFISPGLMPGGIDPGAGELGGLTLAPGIYKSASGTFNISNGPLTLDAQGDPNATWVFQTAAGLTVGIAGPTGARSVVLINGALPKNVFWYVGSAATINGAGGGTMVGTIIATAGVTFSTPGNAVQTVLNGRAISLIASVTMVNTTINVPAP